MYFSATFLFIVAAFVVMVESMPQVNFPDDSSEDYAEERFPNRRPRPRPGSRQDPRPSGSRPNQGFRPPGQGSRPSDNIQGQGQGQRPTPAPQTQQTNTPTQTSTTTLDSLNLGSTTTVRTTRIPPRDPGNRIVYIVPPGCTCPFTRQYSPVCGTDGQTYGNMGVLQCNKSCGTDVNVYLVGACGSNNG